ncbi:MAG: glutathione S-transferase N-terminal domain-containing protein [Rhodanobacteraceae bacterium]
MTVIGSYISPYVRKVLVCLETKRLDYEIDPMRRSSATRRSRE